MGVAEAYGADELEKLSVQDIYRPVTKLKTIPDIPTRRGDRAWLWWSEQIKRCRDGWVAPDGHYLNGFQYFYLNFMQIPIQDKENNIAEWRQPYFRDNDETIFSYLWRNRSRKLNNGRFIGAKNHVEAKCRSIGWTQITLLGVAMWMFIFRPDRAIGMGYSDDEVVGIERLWFQESWAKLPAMLRTWNGQLLKPLYNNKDSFTVGYEDKENGNIVKPHNNVQFKIISDKAGVFKGQRLNLIIAIEAGKWKGDTLKNFYTENLDCLEMGDYKWGMFLIGGTSNVIVNKSTNYKDIFFKAEAYNATKHFTPKTHVLSGYIDMQTGRSKVEEAIKHIMVQRKMREGDSHQYQQYVIENPLTVEECFVPNESFAYDTARLQAQIGFIKTNNFTELWRRGRFEYEWDHERSKQTGKLRFKEDPTGKWLVNLEGIGAGNRYKNLHIAGFDDTYKGADEDKLKKRDSRNCLIIYRQPTAQNIKSDMPVAILLQQTPDMDDTYHEVLKGLRYFDVQQCLYEYNHNGFVKYLKDAGESRRLFWIGNQPGISIKGKVKTELTSLGHAYFRDGRFQNITSVEILEALKVWGSKENTDIGSAFHLVLHLLDQTKDYEVTRRVATGELLDEISSGRVVLGTPKTPDISTGGGESFRHGDKVTEGESTYIKLGPLRSRNYQTHNYRQRTQYA